MTRLLASERIAPGSSTASVITRLATRRADILDDKMKNLASGCWRRHRSVPKSALTARFRGGAKRERRPDRDRRVWISASDAESTRYRSVPHRRIRGRRATAALDLRQHRPGLVQQAWGASPNRYVPCETLKFRSTSPSPASLRHLLCAAQQVPCTRADGSSTTSTRCSPS